VYPQYAKNPIKNYVMHKLADISKAEREIGFKAQSSFDTGIDAIIK
jgi:nucleoside-diphosphate-sugar epimerase